MIRKYHNQILQTNPLHRDEKPPNIYSKTIIPKHTRFLFPFNMIAKLEWTQSNAQQNNDKHIIPKTMGSTLKNISTTTKSPPLNGQQPKPPPG